MNGQVILRSRSIHKELISDSDKQSTVRQDETGAEVSSVFTLYWVVRDLNPAKSQP